MKCTLQRQLLLLAVLAAWLSGGAYGQGLFDSGTAGFYNPCQSPPSSNNAVLRVSWGCRSAVAKVGAACGVQRASFCQAQT